MTRRRAHLSRIPARPRADADSESLVSRFPIGHQMAQRWQKSLSGIPRWGRMLIVAVMSLGVTLAIFPQVDSIYMDRFFDYSTVVVPSLVSAGFGLLMYLAGWILVVGSGGNKPDEQVSSSPALLWYIGLGALALIVCMVLLLHGLTLMDASSGVTLETGI
jgi:hypothetical protein